MEHLILYSNPIPLFYHNRKKYANLFDYILTFITSVILVILLVFYYLKIIKKEPYLYHQIDKIENKANYTLSNLPFYISVVYFPQAIFMDPYLYFIPYLTYNNRSHYESIPLRYCNESELKEVQKILNTNQNLSYLFICPDFQGKEYILKANQNVIRSDNYFFTFNLFKHPNITLDDYELLELYVIWNDQYLDMSDYDNPIKKEGKGKAFNLRNDRLEVFNFFFNLKYYESNKGNLISNKTTTSYLNYDSIEYISLTNRAAAPGTYYQMITLNFYLNTKVHIDSITYMKITDVLTKVVSIYSVIFKFMSIFSKYIRNKSIIIDLTNYVGAIKNNINENNQNEKITSNEIIIKKKKKFKLNLIELLLPSFLLRKNQNIKLYKEYKNFFSSLISVETLINFYLQNNQNLNINTFNEKNIFNQILPLNEQDSELNTHFLDNIL